MFKLKKGGPPTASGEPERKGLFRSLKEGLRRTRQGLLGGLASIGVGRAPVDAAVLEELETTLLSADLGVEATERIVGNLSSRLRRKQLADVDTLYAALREEMLALLEPVAAPLVIPADHPKPFVLLMVGVNGTGKTTTIGKLARRFRDEGRSVMLAAGDTFRAAAIEQLQAWGERNDVPVIAQKSGSDPASVVFDALQAARARGVDVLIADTAGRLHTQANLMEELKKVRRVIGKLDPSAPHETMIVIDATTGQNALVQARRFRDAVEVSGLTLTKLDGTAKGGIIFALAEQLKIPVRFIGIGEAAEDLRVFAAAEFVDALLAREAR